jgi:hypothetical protein
MESNGMFDYLTYYYKAGTIPFKTLSALPEPEAIRLMNEQYVDDPVEGRFRNPEVHLRDRKETEKWLREVFVLKGGTPVEKYPIYFVLGYYKEFEALKIQYQMNIRKIPLSWINENQISFTFFDSMYSYRLGRDKPSEYYQERYHGKIFTKKEILKIVKEKQESAENWWGKIPKDYFPFIEAQVWDHELLKEEIVEGLSQIKQSDADRNGAKQ